MHSLSSKIPLDGTGEPVARHPQDNSLPSITGLISVKKYCAHEVYTKKMTEWPKNSTELFFKDPEALYSKFIKLCYKLQQKGITLNDPNHKSEKQKLQKAFAYLLNTLQADSEKNAEKQRMFLCFNFLSLCPDLINSVSDAGYILNHVSQNKRSWLKVCIAQALRNRKESLELKQKQGGKHDAVLDATYVASELSNIGIVIQEVIGGVFLGQHWIDIGIEVSRYTNPLIYAFKVMQRLFKLAGRKFFGLEFAEDEVGINLKQNLWDGVSASLFLAVTVLLIINTPVLVAAAWLIAPIGLTVVWKSEYGYQNQCASYRQANMKDSEGLFDEQTQAEASRVAIHKKFASWALLGVIVFICLGMLAAHASAIPGLNLIFNEYTLGALTMITGIALAGLAVFRAGNFLFERNGPAMKAALKEFFQHPVDNTLKFFKSVGSSLVSAIKSIPEKAERAFQYLAHEFPVKIVEYWNKFGAWQKAAVILTMASLALSVSVFSGGLPVVIGLAAAGVCSLVASIIKYAPALYAAVKNKSKQKEEEPIERYKDDLECDKAMDEIAQQHNIPRTPIDKLNTSTYSREEQEIVQMHTLANKLAHCSSVGTSPFIAFEAITSLSF